jgi:hypothetical protein
MRGNPDNLRQAAARKSAAAQTRWASPRNVEASP